MNQKKRTISTFKELPLYLMLCMLVFAAAQTDAGEIEPRYYSNAPVGVNFLLAGYLYSYGGLATTGSSPIKDADLSMHTAALAYVRSLDILGRSGKFDVVLAYADLSGTARVANQERSRDVSGFCDPRFRLSVNLYGAPALSAQEFANYSQDIIIGASIQVSAPLGQYDEDKLVNLGTNRWFFKPDIGISKAWRDFIFELSTGVMVFTNNDEYFGGNYLEQNPVSTTQLHVTYSLGKGFWVALSGTYDYGGQTKLNGVQQDDLQNNLRAGMTLAVPINRNLSLKFYGSTGIFTSIGTDFNQFGVALQYRWGGGL